MSKAIDTSAIMQVIGNVYLNPSILDRTDRYTFNNEDFIEEFHKTLFGTIYNLYQLGAKEITPIAIEDYLSSRPKKEAVYKANKGNEYLQKLAETTQTSAFDYYYKRMKKMTLLRMYQDIGVDITWVYDPDNILDIKKKQKQEEYLDNTSIEDIAEAFDKKITDIRLKYADVSSDRFFQCGDGIDELIQRYQDCPDIGIPMYGPYVNTITRGARLTKFYMRSASTGTGKALPNSTKIPTIKGWKTVGEINEGDVIFDAFGRPTSVIRIFPQGNKEVYGVYFKDGRVAKCCNEHLWSFCTNGQKPESKQNRKFYTETVQEILDNRSLYRKGCGFNILVPMNYAVQYPEKKYYLSPYAMGALLGDGSFRYRNNHKTLDYSSEDEFLVNAIAELMGWNYTKNSANNNYTWYFKWKSHPNKNRTTVWVEEALKEYPELWNLKSEDKFIPEAYLQGSVQQRLELLNGLLDTDGSVDKAKGRISYFTVSSHLKDNVVELVRSLGMKATVSEDTHKENICYVIEIAGRPDDKVKLFKLPRKKALIEAWYNNGKKKETNEYNPIIEIKDLGYQEEMTCFLVDNSEHLFLTEDFIVTHNTRALVADACTFSCGEVYNRSSKSWVKMTSNEPTLFIATEQQLSEIQTAMLAFLSAVDEEHILYGDYKDDELSRVKYAAEVLKKAPLHLKELPDFSLQDIENTIKFAVNEWNVKYVAYDYLHSSMKILSEVTSKAKVQGLREDNVLFMISTRLKDLCNQYGIFIITSTQLNASYADAEILDQNCLRGAKSIADRLDIGMIMASATEKDRESLQPLCAKLAVDIPDIKISVYKNRGSRWKDIYLWCKAEKGICRITPIFVTDYYYNYINMEDTVIQVEDKT